MKGLPFVCGILLLVAGALLFSRPVTAPKDVTYDDVGPLFGAAAAPRPVEGAGPEEREREAARDPANPFVWAALADADEAADRIGQARSAWATASARAGRLTEIGLRAAAFHLRHGGRAEARALLRGVLARHPEFSQPVFDLYRTHGLLPPAELETGLPATRGAAEAYFRYLLSQRGGRPEEAYLAEIETAWGWIAARWPASPALADGLVRLHIAERRWDAARAVWRTQFADEGENLLSNPGFERTPQAWLFDWSITPWPHVEAVADGSVAHGGRASLRVRFDGLENPAYSAVAQRVVVGAPGRYCVSFWGKTAGLTSDEGVGIRLFDPADGDRVNLILAGVREPTDWREWRGCLEVPESTRYLELQIIRSASDEPWGRVAGTVWLDDFVLRRESAEVGR